MTEKNRPSKHTAAQDGRKDGDPKKKPYEPPRLVSRHVMEVVASACSPAPPGKASGDALCTIPSS